MTVKDIAIILTASTLAVSMFLIGGIYHICNYIKSKRPHKSDDEEDNPITKFKDDLAEIYESNPNGKLKKLAQAVWNRVEEIEKWHNTAMNDMYRKERSARWRAAELENKCEDYQSELDEWTKRCEELQSKLNESQERLKRESAKVKTLESETDKLRDMLKEKEQPDFLIEKHFPGQLNPFAKVILNTKPGEPLTATEATELAERLHRIASQPIVMDSETLNCDGEDDLQKAINKEFTEKLREIWDREASKAAVLNEAARLRENALRMTYATSYPHSAEHGKPEYRTSEEMQEHYQKVLYVKYKDEPLKCYSVSVYKNEGIRAMFTNWELCAPGITAIECVLSEDGIQVWDYKEMP